MTEAGGDSASDYESDVEDLTVKDGPRKEGDMFGEYSFRKDKIFQYLKIQDKNVSIPNLKKGDEHKMTLFLELDDVLLNTFVCDENHGYIANPGWSKEPDHEFFIDAIG